MTSDELKQVFRELESRGVDLEEVGGESFDEILREVNDVVYHRAFPAWVIGERVRHRTRGNNGEVTEVYEEKGRQFASISWIADNGTKAKWTHVKLGEPEVERLSCQEET